MEKWMKNINSSPKETAYSQPYLIFPGRNPLVGSRLSITSSPLKTRAPRSTHRDCWGVGVCTAAFLIGGTLERARGGALRFHELPSCAAYWHLGEVRSETGVESADGQREVLMQLSHVALAPVGVWTRKEEQEDRGHGAQLCWHPKDLTKRLLHLPFWHFNSILKNSLFSIRFVRGHLKEFLVLSARCCWDCSSAKSHTL